MIYFTKLIFVICLFVPNYLNSFELHSSAEISSPTTVNCTSPVSMSISSPASMGLSSPASISSLSSSSINSISLSSSDEQKQLFDSLLSIKTALAAAILAIKKGAKIDMVYSGNSTKLTNDPNCLNNGDTLIDFAARIGDVNYTRLLLDLGASPNKTPHSSPFRKALLNDHMEVAETLLDSPKFDKETLNQSLIYFISLLQNSKIEQKSIINKILFLINKGADVNYQDDSCSTPLMWATSADNLGVMQTLIENGAVVESIEDPNSFNNVQSFEAFELLTNETDQKNLDKLLMSLISTTENTSINTDFVIDKLNFLITKGANVNYQNNHGITPLMSAVICGNLNIVKELIKLGARCDLRDYFDNTAFKLSESHEKKEISKYLKTATLKEDTKKKLKKYKILSSSKLQNPSLLQDIVCDYLY